MQNISHCQRLERNHLDNFNDCDFLCIGTRESRFFSLLNLIVHEKRIKKKKKIRKKTNYALLYTSITFVTFF